MFENDDDFDLLKADKLEIGTDAYSAEHVDRSELARMMLLWEQKAAELEALGESIKTDVLALAETQTVGNVTAKYTKGRRELDYQTPAMVKVGPDEISPYQQYVPETVIPAKTYVDWKKLCAELEIEPEVTKEGTPSVKIRLLGDE